MKRQTVATFYTCWCGYVGEEPCLHEVTAYRQAVIRLGFPPVACQCGHAMSGHVVGQGSRCTLCECLEGVIGPAPTATKELAIGTMH